jgi:hypothetical protein
MNSAVSKNAWGAEGHAENRDRHQQAPVRIIGL